MLIVQRSIYKTTKDSRCDHAKLPTGLGHGIFLDMEKVKEAVGCGAGVLPQQRIIRTGGFGRRYNRNQSGWNDKYKKSIRMKR